MWVYHLVHYMMNNDYAAQNVCPLYTGNQSNLLACLPCSKEPEIKDKKNKWGITFETNIMNKTPAYYAVHKLRFLTFFCKFVLWPYKHLLFICLISNS